MERSIIHLNVADFAVAVERNRDAGLKGFPLIIAPTGAPRAVVYDMSEEAYREGVRKGMPLNRAVRMSRRARILPPRLNRYELAMKDLVKRSLAYSPLIESGTGDGHLFIDATGSSRLFGPTVDVAWRLHREMKKDFSLDPIWSVAPNKLVAKVATRLAKPTGEYIVGAGEEEAFLAPLPLDLLPGLDGGDMVKLRELNFVRVSQVRALALAQLEVAFRTRAPMIYDAVRGIDNRVIAPAAESGRSLVADHEFDGDTNHTASLKKGLYLLVERLCKQLRRRELLGLTMGLSLSYSDGVRTAARIRLDPPTANDIRMFEGCVPLLFRAWRRRVRIRHMRLTCDKTTGPSVQRDLFGDSGRQERQDALVASMDSIRARFGNGSVTSGLTLVA